MQQYLYLARHAHADHDAFSDEDRQLSPKGQAQLERLVNGLRNKGILNPNTVWQSGLVRARETAETLTEGLNLQIPIAQKSELAPYDDPKGIAEQLDELSHSCLIAGHEPNLSLLSAILLRNEKNSPNIVFAKASILCLSRLRIDSQSTPWQIEWHISHHFFK